jgi:hypothetical protein
MRRGRGRKYKVGLFIFICAGVCLIIWYGAGGEEA